MDHVGLQKACLAFYAVCDTDRGAIYSVKIML